MTVYIGDIGSQLPSRRPLRNMDPSFVEARREELEVYLQVPILPPGYSLCNLMSPSLRHLLAFPECRTVSCWLVS